MAAVLRLPPLHRPGSLQSSCYLRTPHVRSARPRALRFIWGLPRLRRSRLGASRGRPPVCIQHRPRHSRVPGTFLPVSSGRYQCRFTPPGPRPARNDPPHFLLVSFAAPPPEPLDGQFSSSGISRSPSGYENMGIVHRIM
ncbi:hypothetical protein NDU88_001911 [Pleurodeles waltl]|uniref:Uncharacterized protein n=1 Tax=Pleurodeles waltl TaxID=8319 RepID=A0AAV7NDY1_PLEWA|nr:hypothetical protein NDU88_001911 [Pleurodeles waltl]